MQQTLRKNWSLWLITALTLLALGYVAVFGQDIYIATHDNLDSNIPWFTMLRDNGLFASHGGTVPFLGGISRDYLPSELNFYSLLYWLLPAFPAYILGNVLKIVLSVAGWLALGPCLFGTHAPRYRHLLVLGGFVYANLPTFPTAAFVFAGMPLLLALAWQLWRRPRPLVWAGLALWPALSDFSTSGIFACGYMLLFFLVVSIRRRRPCWRLLAGLGVLCAGFLVYEHRLFGVMLFSQEETLRSTMEGTTLGLAGLLRTIGQTFWLGENCGGTLQAWVIMPVCGVYWLASNLSYLRTGRYRKLWRDAFNLLWYTALGNAVLAGVSKTDPFQLFIRTFVPPLDGFNFTRIAWFNGLLLYLAFFVVLARLLRRGWALPAYGLAAAAFAVILFADGETYNDIHNNLVRLPARLRGEQAEELTWEEFYSEDLFTRVKESIGYNGEWSIAYGMHPGILEQNGIATLDGYLSYYSLDYKEQFRALIAPQLETDDYHRTYFDDWGGRAYVFSSDVTYSAQRTVLVDEAVLNIDPAVFRQMGGVYVFSRVAVSNAADLGLESCGVFTGEGSPYTLYVYRAA